jgi:hypothetical protein
MAAWVERRRVGLPVYGLEPVYFNAGLMKPRKGLTLVAGKGKLGVGKGSARVDTLDQTV